MAIVNKVWCGAMDFSRGLKVIICEEFKRVSTERHKQLPGLPIKAQAANVTYPMRMLKLDSQII